MSSCSSDGPGRPARSLLRLVARFGRPYRGAAVMTVLMLAGQSACSLYLPELNARVVDRGIAHRDTRLILSTGLAMLVLVAVMGGFAAGATHRSALVGQGLGRDLRRAVLVAVGHLEPPQLTRLGVASLATRVTNDVRQVQSFVGMVLTTLVLAPVTVLGGTVLAVRHSPAAGVLLLAVLPMLPLVAGLVARRAGRLFGEVQEATDAVARTMREQLAGVRVIRAYGRQDALRDRAATANRRLTASTVAAQRLFAVTVPFLAVVVNLIGVAAVAVAGPRVASGGLGAGELVAFLTYALQILAAVMTAVFALVSAPRAAVSAARIAEVLDAPAAPAGPGGREAPLVQAAPPSPRALAGRAPVAVRLAGVGFRYQGSAEAVLVDVTLDLTPGLTTAVLGGTGAGKSTLAGLVAQLEDPTAGHLLVDGVQVAPATSGRSPDREQLWALLGFVPQTPSLFRGTVAGNVRVGRPDATDEEVWAALRTAQAASFVAEAGGLDAPVERGGANLSGGQRQRLSLARALVRRPRLYVLDDSFTALDTRTTARLRDALRRETVGTTVLLTTQRVATALYADRVVVLDRGRVVGAGTPDELMRGCEAFRSMAAAQVEAAQVEAGGPPR